ncbi:hypothetical protein B0O80DRAFT_453174 [Mortierella sp. GBAus27b]|nr:hypothetical protein B0O80DRAFT_453174 [Mortierella sp. GBAus27b]
MERREREAREEQERKEMERREKERLALHPPSLTLGSFSFNPDPSFANPLPAFDGTMKSGTAGPFGLDTFATIPNLPLAPAHYTGSFNPFSMDDEPLMRRSLVSSVRPLPEDMDYDPASGRSRHVGPPIPGKPRQTSRFGFAMENHYPESFDRKAYLDPSPDLQSAQDGLKTLFPNVNASFGQRNGSMTQPPQHQSQQVQYQTSPLLHRQEANLHDNPWGGVDKQDELYHRKANQLNLGSMMSAPSPHMTEHHHQPPLHQPQQLQRNGPPGLARNTMTPSMIKSPPPGLQSFERPDYENWQSQHDQQRQQYQQLQSHQPQLLQQLHQTPRLNNWTPDSTPGSHNNGSQRDGAHDFFGAFLKAAASQPIQSAPSGANAMPSLAFQDPAIMSARISSGSRKPLMDSLQQPGVGGHQGSFNPMGHDPSLDMRGRVGNNMGNSPLQQHFGLGPKRMDLYPQMKPGNMEAYPGVFGPGEPHLMNTINSAANARSAKIKSDLLMGLNAGIRPERLGVKDPPQHPQQPLGLSEEHASILNSLINGPRIGGTPATNSQFDSGSANPGAFSSVDGDYPNRSFGQHEGHNMNGMYGNNPMISMSLSSAGGVSAVPVAAPPGLGPHLNNVYSGNNGGGADIGMKRMSPSFMNNNNPNLNNYNNGNSNLNRPLDITSMMNSLEFFGPSSSSMSSPTQSVSANNTWSLPNGERMYHPEMNSSRGDSETHSRRDSAQLNTGSQFNDGMQQQQHQQHQHQVGGSTIVNGHGSDNDDSTINSDSNATHLTSSMGNMGDLGPAASTSTRVEDIQLQAINGKMETQMLENQLNAVIKRNRRKLYA